MKSSQSGDRLVADLRAAHVAAWRESGLSLRQYCHRAQLYRPTFWRWVVAIDAARKPMDVEQNASSRRGRKRGVTLLTNRRNRAVQAFWAMHVEAMTWSGMKLRAYADALNLSRYSLKKWRDRIDAGEANSDWRALLHPAARPPVSTILSAITKEETPENGLTDESKSPRRNFSREEKLAIAMEAERQGVTVSAVARKHDIATGVLFRWRTELGLGKEKPAKLVAVRLEDATPGNAGKHDLVLEDLLPLPAGMALIELADGRRVFAPAGTDPEAVRRYVEAAP